MTPVVLTTRPVEDAERDCSYLNAQGAVALSSPMLEIKDCPFTLPPLDSIDAVVLTSRHAASRLKGAGLQDLPCFCVGKTTAIAAGEAGLKQIHTGPGDGKGLARLIAHHPYASLIWPSAVDTGFDISAALEPEGIKTHRLSVYEAAPVESFTPESLEALKSGHVRVVLAHSGRAGEHFTRMIKKEGLGHLLKTMTMIAISTRAAGLCGTDWHSITVVEQPRRRAMLDAAVTALNMITPTSEKR